jgi:hypothetical protein
MRYAVWISTPSPQEAQAVAAQATTVASEQFDFAIRELDGNGELPTVTDLAFHIDSDDGVKDAKTQALKAYALCRVEAGLGPHDDPVARAVVRPQSG